MSAAVSRLPRSTMLEKGGKQVERAFDGCVKTKPKKESDGKKGGKEKKDVGRSMQLKKKASPCRIDRYKKQTCTHSV